jgi:hypothetical protein
MEAKAKGERRESKAEGMEACGRIEGVVRFSMITNVNNIELARSASLMGRR